MEADRCDPTFFITFATINCTCTIRTTECASTLKRKFLYLSNYACGCVYVILRNAARNYDAITFQKHFMQCCLRCAVFFATVVCCIFKFLKTLYFANELQSGPDKQSLLGLIRIGDGTPERGACARGIRIGVKELLRVNDPIPAAAARQIWMLLSRYRRLSHS